MEARERHDGGRWRRGSCRRWWPLSCASCHGVVVVTGLRRGRICRAELVQQRGLCFPTIERRWWLRDEGEEEAREWQLVREDGGSGAGVAGVSGGRVPARCSDDQSSGDGQRQRWRLWSVATAEEREREIRVRVCVGKEMMTWKTLIGEMS
ncbi:hypothetical protein DEO72_LG8g1332 [Vigna unguiculata]|uniref:Uncharacterized protein n=1 Tax=Vigna unguiculata TaxID=3917 RepID=A0A4D6MQI6_VIGUN|nr:hypothetical protein DEO72_LG8g1332 [Vigna unguiculata]